MRPRFLLAVLLSAVLAGCGDATPEVATPDPSIPPDVSGARADLAAIAALAEDHRFSALYDYDAKDGRGVRSVVATVAADGNWRVDVPGGAQGGTVDVAIMQTRDGVFQCTIPSAVNPVTTSCAHVADRGKPVPKEFDPRVERIFIRWLAVFQDRQAPLSVNTVQLLPGAKGACYSVDTVSASLKAPFDVGIYCYANDGLLTAARVGFGTLTLVNTATAPPGVELPGPVTGATPLETKSPPPPPESDPSLAPSGAAG